MYNLRKRYLFIFLIVLNNCWRCSATDLGILFHRAIHILEDADNENMEEYPLVSLNSSIEFFHPKALTYDSINKKFFLGDYSKKTATIYALDYQPNNYIVTNISSIMSENNIPEIESLGFDQSNQRLYMSGSVNPTNSHVYSLPVNEGKGRHSIDFVDVQGSVTDIAMDNCDNLTYWLVNDLNGTKIEVSSTTTNASTVIKWFTNDDFQYVSMAVDSDPKYLILGRHNKNTKECIISMFSLHTNKIVMNITQVDPFPRCNPHHITVDHDYLYWCDHYNNGGAILRIKKSVNSKFVMISPLRGFIIKPELVRSYAFSIVTIGKTDSTNICNSGNSSFIFNDIATHQNNTYKTTHLDNPNETELEIGPEDKTSNTLLHYQTRLAIDQEGTTSNTRVHDQTGLAIDPEDKTSSSVLQDSTAIINSSHAPVTTMSPTITIRPPDPSKILHIQLTTDKDVEVVTPFPYSAVKQLNLEFSIHTLIVYLLLLLSVTINVLLIYLLILRNKSIKLQRSSESSKSKKCFPRVVKRSKQWQGESRTVMDDGISIDIEDCCQMTVCDSPCYTSMKKEGKKYQGTSKLQKKHLDIENTSLLD